MKVIELLNKIANGEEVPKKIRIAYVDDRITQEYKFFYDKDDHEYKDDELFPLGARLILDRVLNEKVEIIEEDKKIEKVHHCYKEPHNEETEFLMQNINFLSDKINEIIEVLNER